VRADAPAGEGGEEGCEAVHGSCFFGKLFCCTNTRCQQQQQKLMPRTTLLAPPLVQQALHPDAKAAGGVSLLADSAYSCWLRALQR
jgi:hypothetical protein